jgi:hypothetical protein
MRSMIRPNSPRQPYGLHKPHKEEVNVTLRALFYSMGLEQLLYLDNHLRMHEYGG